MDAQGALCGGYEQRRKVKSWKNYKKFLDRKIVSTTRSGTQRLFHTKVAKDFILRTLQKNSHIKVVNDEKSIHFLNAFYTILCADIVG
jgi:hypothetical protein